MFEEGAVHRFLIHQESEDPVFVEREEVDRSHCSHRSLATQLKISGQAIGGNILCEGDELKFDTGSGTVPAATRQDFENAIKRGYVLIDCVVEN